MLTRPTRNWAPANPEQLVIVAYDQESGTRALFVATDDEEQNKLAVHPIMSADGVRGEADVDGILRAGLVMAWMMDLVQLPEGGL